jgi:Zn-dependent protease with chaperone function
MIRGMICRNGKALKRIWVVGWLAGFPYTLLTASTATVIPGPLKMNASASSKDHVNVCIDKAYRLPDLQFARLLAGRIFAGIGTRIEWRCGSTLELPIMITISTQTPAAHHPEALAYAQPFTGGIRIFFDRLQNYEPGMRGPVLAYVLAHEIGHVLQGMTRHSETGIMKAHWDAQDLRRMGMKELAFTPYDVLLINHGIALALPSVSRFRERAGIAR